MAAKFPSDSEHQFIAHFLSLITHELRSPLNTINGYLDLALDGVAGELNEQQREFIQRARSGSTRLYTLLEDLLLISRADAGQLRLNREPVALYDLARDVQEELELPARDAEVTLKLEAPADLPPLFVDAVRLQQVLRNLLSNALRFTASGGTVVLSARLLPGRGDEQKKIVELCVRDSGCGIAAEYHERIFERFFQVPQPGSGRISGQGLGLAAVKIIIELHGSQIHLESIPGQGSAFLFTLDVLS